MALLACRGCTALYSVGAPACPQCGSHDYEEEGMAKANPLTGSTLYLGEGAGVPADLPEGVTLVGPGAPADEPADEPAGEAGGESPPAPVPATTPGQDSTPPGNSGESSAPASPPPAPDVAAQMTVTAEAKKAVSKDG
jgi:hypothetical protein